MSSLPALTAISNGTAADATEVDGNFDTLATFVDGELVNRDGTVAMTGELTLSSSTPSGALVAASKGYVDSKASGSNVAVFQRTTNVTTTGLITFETESNDSDGWWSSGTTFTCPADGVYMLSLRGAVTSGSATIAFLWGSSYALDGDNSIQPNFASTAEEAGQMSGFVKSGATFQINVSANSGTIDTVTLYIVRLALV